MGYLLETFYTKNITLSQLLLVRIGFPRLTVQNPQTYNTRMIEQALIESRNWAEVAFDAADDMQASNIVLLDVQEACDFADYFVILTADSSRQLRALVEDIEEQMSAVGAHLHHVEGTHNSGWILMDYGGVIVHMMGPDERDYYGLENVWPEARRIRIIP